MQLPSFVSEGMLIALILAGFAVYVTLLVLALMSIVRGAMQRPRIVSVLWLLALVGFPFLGSVLYLSLERLQRRVPPLSV